MMFAQYTLIFLLLAVYYGSASALRFAHNPVTVDTEVRFFKTCTPGGYSIEEPHQAGGEVKSVHLISHNHSCGELIY